MPRKEPPRPRRTGWVVLLVVGVVVATAAAVAQTWTNLRAIEYGYMISKASKQRTTLEETHRRLRAEEALLKSPERLSRLAVSYGLQPPEPHQVRRLNRAGQRLRYLSARTPRSDQRIVDQQTAHR